MFLGMGKVKDAAVTGAKESPEKQSELMKDAHAGGIVQEILALRIAFDTFFGGDTATEVRKEPAPLFS